MGNSLRNYRVYQFRHKDVDTLGPPEKSGGPFN